MKVIDLQQQVVRGEYRVDADAVAEAILRRLLGGRGLQTGSRHDPSAGT